MSSDVTIRVSREVRERINANAERAGGISVNSYLEGLLNRAEWRLAMAEAARQMRGAEQDETYQEEVRWWDEMQAQS